MRIKKSEFINIIQNLETFSSPKLIYEQYITDAVATADIFFHMAFTRQDIEGNIIVDLGCGTGNLTIAAVLLGSERVIAVDIDKNSLKVLSTNLKNLELETHVQAINIDLEKQDLHPIILKIKENEGLSKNKVVVISNPPFGVQKRGADIVFLTQALKFADVIYSIHLSSEKNREFLSKKIAKMGGIITERSSLFLMLKNTYKHHKLLQKKIKTDVYRIIPKEY